MAQFIKAVYITIYISIYAFKFAIRKFEIYQIIGGFVDELTGLPNRRYFNFYTKNKTNLTYIAMDLDNFKKINDTQGHLAGDLTLIKVGKFLANIPYGKAFRIGGDEFVIVIENKNQLPELTQFINERFKSETDVNVSWGAADCLNEADNKLYKHKRQKVSLS